MKQKLPLQEVEKTLIEMQEDEYNIECTTFPILLYFSLVEKGYIIPGVDGIGYFGTAEKEDRQRSIIRNKPLPTDTHVYWYDK